MSRLIRATLVVAFLFSLALASPIKSERQSDWTTQVWDAIVVGAGPAGIIVADRLSEAGKKTLLLEQGGVSYGITGGTEKPSWLSGTSLSRVDVPGLYKSIFSGSSPLLCGSKVNAYGGCTIGGSSAINAGLYFQPPASDWDTFHPAGWKSADVQTATQKLLARQASVVTTSKDGKYYLQSGYNAARQWLVNGAGFADVTINNVANQKYKVFGRPAYDYSNGQRGGPVTTYLQTALKRSNFMLQSSVQVKRVVRSKGQATGIVAVVNGVQKTIALSSTGRVVLSGGAIFSPQILMYSGIGPSDTLTTLSKAGILGGLAPSDWINNTAVGAQLFDNPNTFIELESSSVQSYTYSYSSPPASDSSLYLNSRSGPYTFASQTSVFWSYVNHTDGSPPTGVQGTIDSSGYSDWANSNNAITLNIYGTSGLKSSGRVVLDSKYIAGPSSGIYYSDPRDADDIATFIRSIFDSMPQSGLTPKNIAQTASKDDIKRYITTPSAYAVGMVNHWSSSCRIGTCVDATTKVIGMNNLYVIDGSIVNPLTVNPQFGIMVAAEKGAALILSNWK